MVVVALLFQPLHKASVVKDVVALCADHGPNHLGVADGAVLVDGAEVGVVELCEGVRVIEEGCEVGRRGHCLVV